MDKALIIKRQLKIIGNTVYLHDGEWSSMPFRAVVQHLWRKKSSNFESTLTELGSVNAEYYLYIGPSNSERNCNTYAWKRGIRISLQGRSERRRFGALLYRNTKKGR